MDKEYISPEVGTVKVLCEASVLSASVEGPELEDFDVSDGEW
jgi:hypothetical protein